MNAIPNRYLRATLAKDRVARIHSIDSA